MIYTGVRRAATKLAFESTRKSVPHVEQRNQILVDRWYRKHDYLRISLTDRCNFRCQYCMPEEGLDNTCSASEDVLKATEIGAIVRTFVQNFGIRKIRLTGG